MHELTRQIRSQPAVKDLYCLQNTRNQVGKIPDVMSWDMTWHKTCGELARLPLQTQRLLATTKNIFSQTLIWSTKKEKIKKRRKWPEAMPEEDEMASSIHSAKEKRTNTDEKKGWWGTYCGEPKIKTVHWKCSTNACAGARIMPSFMISKRNPAATTAKSVKMCNMTLTPFATDQGLFSRASLLARMQVWDLHISWRCGSTAWSEEKIVCWTLRS